MEKVNLTKLYLDESLSCAACQINDLSAIDTSWMPKHIQNSSSKARQLQYYASRMALKSALEQKKIFKVIKSLKLNKDYSTIEGHHFQISLAHTKNNWGLAAIHNSQSIGVDMELADRAVKSGALKYFKNPKDNLESFSVLELWTKKEAAFKALSSSIRATNNLLLAHIWIDKDGGFSHQELNKTLGQVKTQTVTLNNQDFLISWAITF